jgi:hypothetical protein
MARCCTGGPVRCSHLPMRDARGLLAAQFCPLWASALNRTHPIAKICPWGVGDFTPGFLKNARQPDAMGEGTGIDSSDDARRAG